MNWAAGFGKVAQQPVVPEQPSAPVQPVDPAKPAVKTGDSMAWGLYAMTTLIGFGGIVLLKKRYN